MENGIRTSLKGKENSLSKKQITLVVLALVSLFICIYCLGCWAYSFFSGKQISCTIITALIVSYIIFLASVRIVTGAKLITIFTLGRIK